MKDLSKLVAGIHYKIGLLLEQKQVLEAEKQSLVNQIAELNATIDKQKELIEAQRGEIETVKISKNIGSTEEKEKTKVLINELVEKIDNITVHIAERPYRLKVTSEEEEANARYAAQEIERELKLYKDQYHFNDMQDLLSMLLLQYANKSLSLEKQLHFRDKELESKLYDIEQLLNDNTPKL